MTSDLILKKFKAARMPRRILAFLLAALAILSAVVATISYSVASAQSDAVVGDPVSEKQMTVLVTAAASCPVLTPARIAGQLMAESGLDNRAEKTTSGGRGIAGLRDGDWKSWKPWPAAQRSDTSAGILALAHQMCDFTGQLRVAGVTGDQWRLAVAAFHIGLPAVTEANRVPDAAAEYVDQVSDYAGYYGKLKQFGGAGTTAPTLPAVEAKHVPAAYVPLVVEAGSVCDQVTPPLVAAQLMAQSGFDANRLGPAGQRGIAQFLPEVWQSYGPTGGSVWEPEVAIPALGDAMCGLVKELSALEGDPLLLALAAYRDGITAVRQSGGTIDRHTETFLRSVKSLADIYALDSRLTGSAPTAPSPSTAPPYVTPTPTKDTQPSGAPSPSTDRPTGAPSSPAASPTPAPKPTRPAGAVQIYHVQTKLCVSSGSTGSGTRLKLRACAEEPAQWWDARDDGTFRSRGLCMEVAFGGSDDGTPVQAATCTAKPAQQWQLNAKSRLVSKLNDRVLDVRINDEDKPVEIWTNRGYADQVWQLR
ncbi:hypothetical protein E0H26_28705 [Micromonospora zingiberis]|uniref:Ricin B lectin domain-containing protein n=1 Tax=Micromonospora zingiberis TaxID=2053011 RepID=A0A4R0FWR7_9ACTN|nr:ricin-type beta-trefoil lectin domain protein [Micromonospora zingiberis]TCB87877.1 hypothetical protein E0H26_28705 [Micromonospora zingiberis]